MKSNWFRGSVIPWLALAALGLTTNAAFGQIIPADRRVDWVPGQTVGVPGGIPNRTTIFTTLPAGATVAQINSAIAACPSNQVVQLSSGTYNISGQISFGYAKGVTLRGAGTNTILKPTASLSYFIFVGGYSTETAGISITGGYAKGASNLTVASTAGLVPGLMVRIDQLNDPALMWTVSGTERVQNQFSKIQSINGNVVTIWPPLHWGATPAGGGRMMHYGGLNRQADMCGVEDMHIDCSAFTVSSGIYFHQAFGCWVKNVQTTKVNNYHITLARASRCELVRCFVNDSPEYTPNHAGVLVGVTAHGYGATGCLIYDSIMFRAHPGVEVNAGSSGCVIAYNYVVDTRGRSSQGRGIYSNHEAHNMMNLYEGNIVNAFMNDGYFGSSSHNTYFRNWGTGWTETYGNDSSFCIALCRWSLFENVVGNVWGVTNFTPAYYAITNGAYGTEPTWSHVYRWGYPNAGNDGYSGIRPPSTDLVNAIDLWVERTAIVHGNWDSKTRRVIWSPTILDQNLPNSLYLTGKPLWFGNLNWPPFNPRTGYTNLTFATIPAGYRYVHGRDPAPGGPVNNPPFVNASGSPRNGLAPLPVNFSSAGSSDPEGATLTYSWNFGDGSALSTAANPSHTYNAEGTFAARLTVSDGTNQATSADITIVVGNQPPVAVASANPTTGSRPLTVAFSSAGSSDPEGATLSYSWDFGDGSGTSAVANPSHTYDNVGVYTARLTVSDGAKTASTNLTITVANVATGLVAAYGFDENSGTSAGDLSGNGNNGIVTDAIWASGKYGSALNFNGATHVVTVPSAASLNLTTAFTLSAWVYPTAAQTSWRSIMHKQADAYYLHAGNPNGALLPAGGAIFNGVEQYTHSPNPIAVNTWTHVATTYDGVTLAVYVNGTLAGSRPMTGTVQTTGNPLRIGANTYSGQNFVGMIDEVRIYNRSLSAGELQQVMTTPVSGPPRPATPQNFRFE